jgi:hypothetical protein
MDVSDNNACRAIPYLDMKTSVNVNFDKSHSRFHSLKTNTVNSVISCV